MNFTYSIITLLILAFLLIRQLKVWRFRVFLSPGFYFAAFWILGVLGVSLFAAFDMIPIVYPEYINELNILVGFTGLCFLLITSWGRNKVKEGPIRIDYATNTVFNILSLILLFAAIADFIRLGGNFNMGAAREVVHENMLNRPVWIGYAETLSLPLSVFAGYKVFHNLVNKKKESFSQKVFLMLPLFANLIFSVNVGGRVNFVYAFIYYLIGCSFAIPLKISVAKLKKPIIFLTVSVFILISFITSVAAQREEHYNGIINEKQVFFSSRYKIISFMYGPIEYMTASYYGYQFRRADYVDLNNLGYGIYTFNGFINWTIPFTGQLGLDDMSIAKVFDIYYDTKETYDYERVAFYCTHSSYIPLVKDYGISLLLYIVIAILVFLSHYLFAKVQQRQQIKYACSLFLYYLFWIYWVKSNYLGTLSSTILIPLYGFLIVDLMNNIFRKINN